MLLLAIFGTADVPLFFFFSGDLPSTGIAAADPVALAFFLLRLTPGSTGSDPSAASPSSPSPFALDELLDMPGGETSLDSSLALEDRLPSSPDLRFECRGLEIRASDDVTLPKWKKGAGPVGSSSADPTGRIMTDRLSRTDDERSSESSDELETNEVVLDRGSAEVRREPREFSPRSGGASSSAWRAWISFSFS
jgi:hypothetical protein